MKIRPFEEKDRETVRRICLLNSDLPPESDGKGLSEFILTMFCDYYITEEHRALVATDDSDNAIGYIYGTADFFEYKEKFTPYLKKIQMLSASQYYSDAVTEMYDHSIYYKHYPAHFHIDVLDGYRGFGCGKALINAFCDNLKNDGVNGVMLIVGSDNLKGRSFYEQNGFRLLCDKPTGAAYGKKL